MLSLVYNHLKKSFLLTSEPFIPRETRGPVLQSLPLFSTVALNGQTEQRLLIGLLGCNEHLDVTKSYYPLNFMTLRRNTDIMPGIYSGAALSRLETKTSPTEGIIPV